MMRSGWLRAAVLGSNDGILSTASIAIGVTAASSTREPIVLATLAGLIAGALSMAAGEYVSVSSQSDMEKSDLSREDNELKVHPEHELQELIEILESRGMTTATATQAAKEMTEFDALATHAREELGINDFSTARPLVAALASALSFLAGGLFPLLLALFAPMDKILYLQYAFAILFLALSGWVAARIGGSGIWISIGRICMWGTIAMAASAGVGYLFGVNV